MQKIYCMFLQVFCDFGFQRKCEQHYEVTESSIRVVIFTFHKFSILIMDIFPHSFPIRKLIKATQCKYTVCILLVVPVAIPLKKQTCNCKVQISLCRKCPLINVWQLAVFPVPVSTRKEPVLGVGVGVLPLLKPPESIADPHQHSV